MDSLLTKISRKRSGQKFLRSMLIELENTLGPGLHFANGRFYEKHEHEYVLVYANDSDTNKKLSRKPTIPADSKLIGKLLKSGSKIYSESDIASDTTLQSIHGTNAMVAFSVQRSKDEWIVFFDLTGVWQKDEILFYVNTIRTALNHRLLADSVNNDWQQAAQIQRSLLPEYAPVLDDYQIFARTQLAQYVGGDFYDFYRLEYGILGIVLGDASGHGLPAALLVRDVITGLRMGLTIDGKMVNVLKVLNRIVQRNTYSALFASLIYGEIEDEGNFTYVNAGHPPPLLIGQDSIVLLCCFL
jgi:sigma-B regulation protein RsbU (phosphoserine phosphatase)